MLENKRLFGDIIRGLSLALDFDEGQKLFHAWRTAVLAHRLARTAGTAEPERLYYAGLLHDIGAVGLPEHAVHSAINNFVNTEAKQHTRAGERILRPFSVFSSILPIIADHHERCDGSGFPAGKKDAELSIETYLLAAADSIDITARRAPPQTRQRRVLDMLQAQANRAWPRHVTNIAFDVIQDTTEDILSIVFDDTALRLAVYSIDCTPDELAGISKFELLSQLLWMFSRLIDAKHSGTMGHSVRTAYYAYHIAQACEGAPISSWDVLWAGLLHDVGKVGVPRRLLDKPNPLTAEEREIVRKHARDTMDIIGTIGDLAYLAYPAAAHHERYDGTGYPLGRAGEDIPLLGRILAFADAYDIRMHDPDASHAGRHEIVLSWIRDRVGIRFDPALAPIALRVLDAHGRQQRPLPKTMEGFHAFFQSDVADVRRILDPDAGTQPSKHRSGPRGVLLVELEPWSEAVLDDSFRIHGGAEALSKLSGQPPGDTLESFFSASDATEIRQQCVALGPGETATRYGFTPAGRPLEVLLTRKQDDYHLYCRSAENRLQSMQRMALFYRNFLSSAEAAFFTDSVGTIIDVNRTFLDVFDFKLRDIIGSSTTCLTPDAHASPDPTTPEAEAPQPGGAGEGGAGTRGAEPLSVLAPFRSLEHLLKSSTTGSWAGELLMAKRGGSTLPVHFTVATVRDPSGLLTGYVGRAIDISSRRQLEAELQQKNAELRSLSRFKSDMIAMTSHDLKAPVSAMISYANLMQHKLPGISREDAERYVNRIIKSGHHLLTFISDILDLEKAESGTLELQCQPLLIETILDACVSTQRTVADDKQIVITQQTQGEAQLTLADSSRLEQVFNNLLSNAIKFSPRGGEVEVAYRTEQDDSMEICISDSGPGIPEQDLPFVFDRYFQVQTPGAKSSRGSVGLGLSIARTIVMLHGGTITATNRPVGGCAFTLSLPRRIPKTQAKGDGALIVSSDSALCTLIIEMLERRGIRCEVAQRDSALRGKIILFSPRWLMVQAPDCDSFCQDLLTFAAELDPKPAVIGITNPGEIDAPYPRQLIDRILTTPFLDVELYEIIEDLRLVRPATPEYP